VKLLQFQHVFDRWPFMTTHTWGEDPRGEWILTVGFKGEFPQQGVRCVVSYCHSCTKIYHVTMHPSFCLLKQPLRPWSRHRPQWRVTSESTVNIAVSF